MKVQTFTRVNPQPSLITQKRKLASTLFISFNQLMIPAKTAAHTLQKLTTRLLVPFTTVIPVLFTKKKANARLVVFLCIMQWFCGLTVSTNVMPPFVINLEKIPDGICKDMGGIYVIVPSNEPSDEKVVYSKYASNNGSESLLTWQSGNEAWQLTKKTPYINTYLKSYCGILKPPSPENKFDVFNGSNNFEGWTYSHAATSTDYSVLPIERIKNEIQIQTILPHNEPTAEQLAFFWENQQYIGIVNHLAATYTIPLIIQQNEEIQKLQREKQPPPGEIPQLQEEIPQLQEEIPQLQGEIPSLMQWIYFLVSVIIILILILLYVMVYSPPSNSIFNPFTSRQDTTDTNSERNRIQNMGRVYIQGDVVKMKNFSDTKWKDGIVTSINPVKIKESTQWWWSSSSSWDQIKHVHPRV